MKSQKGLPRKTHGLSLHPLYHRFMLIMDRCYNPKNIGYSRYGERGIFVCDTWREFPVNFIYWALGNGWEPHLQIDRIDNNGNYTPDNCRFVSNAENMRNSRSAKLTHKQVIEIRNLLDNGHTCTDISKWFKVTRQNISKIKNNNTWKDMIK